MTHTGILIIIALLLFVFNMIAVIAFYKLMKDVNREMMLILDVLKRQKAAFSILLKLISKGVK